jgi:hypothetical protein
MTKHRQPRTEFTAASYCISELSGEIIKDATRKSISSLRRASNPDDEEVQISFRDAASLDAALIRNGHDPKFLEAMQNIIEENAGRDIPHRAKNLFERLAETAEAVGNIASEIRAAHDPKGPGGSDVVPYECDRIEVAICEAIETLESKRRDIQAIRAGGNVHNIKKEAS